MKCKNCSTQIASCENCGMDFEEEDTIICIDEGNGGHICENCIDDWAREHHSFYETIMVEE